MTTINEIQALFDALDHKSGQVRQDQHLSAAGQAERIAGIRSQTQATARQQAYGFLRGRHQQVKQTRQAYDDALSAARAAVDPQRELAALTKVKVLIDNSRSWDQLVHAVDKVLGSGDPYAVRALGDMAPAIQTRFVGTDHLVDIPGMERRIAGAVADLDPDPVKETRSDLERAQQRLMEAEQGLKSIRFRRQFKGEQTDWVDDLLDGRTETRTTETSTGGHVSEMVNVSAFA